MMKQKEVFNKIGGIIKELNDQYQYLQADSDNLHDLELELFVANTHFLADHAEVLRKINKQNTPAEKPVEEKPAEEKITEHKAPSHEEVFFEPVIRQPEPEPEIIKHELEIDESWEDEEPINDIEPEEEEAITSEEQFENELPQEEEIVAEAPTVEVPEPIVSPAEPIGAPPVDEVDEVYTINQKISAQMGNNSEPVLQPISDLKSAITLNEKLLFVKDLFNGYSLAYSEAIEILNRFKGLEEAETFLKKNYMTKNNWEAKPDTMNRFFELLKRRYA